MASYILIAQIDVPPEREDEFNRLYDTEHLPRLSAVPGVISGRRYELSGAVRGGMPRYLAIYELESPAVAQSEAWRVAGETPNWLRVRETMTARMGGTFKLVG